MNINSRLPNCGTPCSAGRHGRFLPSDGLGDANAVQLTKPRAVDHDQANDTFEAWDLVVIGGHPAAVVNPLFLD